VQADEAGQNAATVSSPFRRRLSAGSLTAPKPGRSDAGATLSMRVSAALAGSRFDRCADAA